MRLTKRIGIVVFCFCKNICQVTSMIGNILAYASITLPNGANLNGRALAQTGQVSLDTNHVSGPGCVQAATATPTATSTAIVVASATATSTPANTQIGAATATASPTNTQVGVASATPANSAARCCNAASD